MDSSKAYRPGDTVKLNLKTESRALVALGAVDTALYAVGGKSHKPLDMVKVGQVLSLILLSLRGSSSCCPNPRPATRTHSAGLLPLLPRALAPVASVSTLCVSLVFVWTLPSHLQLSMRSWPQPLLSLQHLCLFWPGL